MVRIVFDTPDVMFDLLTEIEIHEPRLGYRFEELCYTRIREHIEDQPDNDKQLELLDELYGLIHQRHETVKPEKPFHVTMDRAPF